MNKALYLGVRAEVARKLVPEEDVLMKYNDLHSNTKIIDPFYNGKIMVEKTRSAVVAHGEKCLKGNTGLVNFAVMAELKNQNDVLRVVQIINVLGNNRLIRERTSLFSSGNSLLNSIPELSPIRDAFIEVDKLIPGFVKSGWYYAPEAIFAK